MHKLFGRFYYFGLIGCYVLFREPGNDFYNVGLVLVLGLAGSAWAWFSKAIRQSAQHDRQARADEHSRRLNPNGPQLSKEDQEIEQELEQWITDAPAPLPYLMNPPVVRPGLEKPLLPIALYLRPFAFDGEIMVRNPESSCLGMGPFYKEAKTINLEELLAYSLVGIVDLVGIGRPGEVWGSGKITVSDEEWREEFKRLAAHAAVIISVPALYRSTIWELEWLASQGMFDKTLMLFTKLHTTGAKDDRFDLASIRKAISACGWQIPLKISPSSALRFDSRGRHRHHDWDTGFKRTFIRKTVGDILDLQRDDAMR